MAPPRPNPGKTGVGGGGEKFKQGGEFIHADRSQRAAEKRCQRQRGRAEKLRWQTRDLIKERRGGNRREAGGRTSGTRGRKADTTIWHDLLTARMAVGGRLCSSVTFFVATSIFVEAIWSVKWKLRRCLTHSKWRWSFLKPFLCCCCVLSGFGWVATEWSKNGSFKFPQILNVMVQSKIHPRVISNIQPNTPSEAFWAMVEHWSR